jgi:hypothetical protein
LSTQRGVDSNFSLCYFMHITILVKRILRVDARAASRLMRNIDGPIRIRLYLSNSQRSFKEIFPTADPQIWWALQPAQNRPGKTVYFRTARRVLKLSSVHVSWPATVASRAS